MKRTIKEWLEELPDGYRERALRNYDPDYHDGSTIHNLSYAILDAFDWKDTPEEEGYEFWDTVHDWTLGHGELPPLPEEE